MQNSFSSSPLVASLLLLATSFIPSLAQAQQQVRTPSFYIFQSPIDAASKEGVAPSTEPKSDPLEVINRPIYYFNETVDKAVLKPVARGYDYITPSLVKKGVNNFFQNLKEPGNLLNYALQGKKEDFGNSAGRFLTNTTFGIGGIFDIASDAQMRAHNTNFGQTLSYHRVAPGPYVVLPFFGPSNIRDTVGFVLVDVHTKPQNYLHGQDQTATLATETVSTRAQYLKATDLVDEAVVGDKYSFVKNAYEQRVRSQDQRTQEDKQEEKLAKEEAKTGGPISNESATSKLDDPNSGKIADEERYDLPAK